jgi:K+-transporting ATPase ATPase C chain
MMRQVLVALRLIIVMTVVLGIAYPAAILLVGRAIPGAAEGSLVRDESGVVVGSSLIGQDFTDDEWFWPRPSAGGYDALASGGSNLAADNPDLVAAVAERQVAVSAAEGVPVQAVTADSVTASGSGLDPHISPEYARQQVDRVAAARGLDREAVAALVDSVEEGRLLGFIGEPRVNVLMLNLALAELAGRG